MHGALVQDFIREHLSYVKAYYLDRTAVKVNMLLVYSIESYSGCLCFLVRCIGNSRYVMNGPEYFWTSSVEVFKCSICWGWLNFVCESSLALRYEVFVHIRDGYPKKTSYSCISFLLNQNDLAFSIWVPQKLCPRQVDCHPRSCEVILLVSQYFVAYRSCLSSAS